MPHTNIDMSVHQLTPTVQVILMVTIGVVALGLLAGFFILGIPYKRKGENEWGSIGGVLNMFKKREEDMLLREHLMKQITTIDEQMYADLYDLIDTISSNFEKLLLSSKALFLYIRKVCFSYSRGTKKAC